VPNQERNWFLVSPCVRTHCGARRRHSSQSTKRSFGAAVWLNGVNIGEHLPCFTAAIFDVSKAVRRGKNELGSSAPERTREFFPQMFPQGRLRESPLDTRHLRTVFPSRSSGNPVIETIQVAPKISGSSIVIQNRSSQLRCHAGLFQPHPSRARLEIKACCSGVQPRNVFLLRLGKVRSFSKLCAFLERASGLPKLRTSMSSSQTLVAIPRHSFWNARIALRHCNSTAYLNGRVYFLRGSNITLHRFFRKIPFGTLPWDAAWVRKLLVDIPHEMHWNSFRFWHRPRA